MKPGEFIPAEKSVEINTGREVKTIKVLNTGDRSIQVGSHFHFFEANRFLSFDRIHTYGFRLDIPSGTAVRFEPGEEKECDLVKIAGNCRIRGFNNLVDAQANGTNLKPSLEKAELKGFR